MSDIGINADWDKALKGATLNMASDADWNKLDSATKKEYTDYFFQNWLADNVTSDSYKNITQKAVDRATEVMNNYYRENYSKQGLDFTPYVAPNISEMNSDRIKESLNNIKNMTSAAASVDTQPQTETYKNSDITKDPDYQSIMDLVNQSISGGMPTFNPEDANKWASQLDQIYAPYEKASLQQQIANNARSMPLGGNSSMATNMLNDIYSKYASQKASTALDLANKDYDRKLDIYNTGLTNKMNMFGVKNNTDLARLGLQMNSNQTLLNRAWGLEDRDFQANLARELAAMQQSSTDPLSGLLGGLSTGIGYAIGGPLGGLIGTGMFASPQKYTKNNQG